MQYHIALHRAINFTRIDQEAAIGTRPRHVLWALSQRLKATFQAPENEPILPIDKLRSKLIGAPENWAMARRIADQLSGDDLIYCTGEAVAVPIATLCRNNPNPPKIATFIHGIHRLRAKAALTFFQTMNAIDLFITNCQSQVNILRHFFKVPEQKIFLILEQTDTQFFTPGPVSPGKLRPLIASVGLERRDYRLLAAATADLDVDVKISGFSADVKAQARSFPKVMPANMSQRFYEWTELRQLYRDADLVVVSLFETEETSGVTTLMEAMACGAPVIVSHTQGLTDYLQAPGTVLPVRPSNLQELRQAIAQLLEHPQKAKTLAEQGYQYAQKYHNSERFVEILATRLVLM